MSQALQVVLPTRKSPRNKPAKQQEGTEAVMGKGKREVKQSKQLAHPYTTKFGSAAETSEKPDDETSKKDKMTSIQSIPPEFSFNLNITQEMLLAKNPEEQPKPADKRAKGKGTLVTYQSKKKK